MKRVLITGAAGFVGYHLARHLLSGGGVELVLTDNFFRGKHDEEFEALLKEPNVTFMELDLTDRTAWEKLSGEFDRVYHLAAVNGTKLFYEMPHEVLRINTLTIVYGLEWFKNHKTEDGKILFTSSNEAYAGALEAFGQLPIPTPEEVPLVISDVTNPRWSYAGSKLIGEQFFVHYAKAFGFRMSIVRPHNFYGPRAGYHHVIPQFALRTSQHTDPFQISGADETRSFCYITDAVDAMERVMESSKTDGGIYHIGVTEEVSIGDLAEKIFNLIGWHPATVEKLPSLQGSVKRRAPDIAKIMRDTGWEPITPLQTGLQETVAWYQKHPAP